MKRGCVLTLLILVALLGGYWYLLHGKVEPPVLWWSVGIASFFMWISTGALRTAAMAARDASRVASQSSFGGFSGEEMTDGETVTIVGRVRALGTPLRAPFSDQPAVLYSYEIEHVSQDPESTSTAKDYSGFALAPTAIDSSRGSINLLGFPLLEGFPKTTIDTDAARQNAAAYIASASFTDMQGFHPGQIYHQIRDILTEDDGHLRKDWKMTEDRDLSDKTLTEQIVAPGEQVCVIGSWSAAKHGLVPGGTDGVIQLLRGDPQRIESGLWGKCIRNVIGGLVVAAIVNAGVYTILRAAAGDPHFSFLSHTAMAQHSIHADEMLDAIASGNVPEAEKLLRNGTGINVRDSDGRAPLAKAPNTAMAHWLIAHGADVNASRDDGQTVLMEQAAAGNADVVRVLVNSGAKLDVVSSKWHTTALQRALDAEKLDVVRILRDAGAKDTTASESNGLPLHENDPPVQALLAYLDAMQREDFDGMLKFSTFKPSSDVDFKFWKKYHFAHPGSIIGYVAGDSATIVARGAVPNGTFETYTFTVVRVGTEWRVSDERWETRLRGHEL
ncbi:MAG TPA: ankyrin repeat domain-containing protein [Thermoanaerobaculia bacterium]|nr:ankyrin repeat domain-containing protein [Thermoanaerobaculia bacterium]